MSTKTSAQPGRRTPLSLSGAVTKSHPNKGPNNIANGSGNNANGHQTSNNNKQDNKSQQQKNDQPVVNNLETKDNPNKKQQTQTEKKPQQYENKKPNDKSQNGVGSNKQQEQSESKQQSKEKVQQPNGSDGNKVNEKEKKEKSDKPDKPDKPEKPKDKSEKDICKLKEDKKEEQNLSENKKEEKKIKESKDSKEEKKEWSTKSDAITETQQQIKGDDKKAKNDDKVKSIDKKLEEKVEKMDAEEQKEEKSSNSVTPKSTSKANKTVTPVNKTPTKLGEKTPQKSTPINSAKTTPVTKREVTTAIDDNDIEMEPLAIESSPLKPSQPEEVATIKIAPSATSTPGKLHLPKRNSGVPISDVQLAMQPEISPERPRMFSQISGRKSIRPISDYTPSKFQSNLQFRESYRRINTELDVTNTSMNVTVGSEVPSNFSFSFFGRGRKRDRTPPQHSQSAIGELQTDIEISPPKKARLDIHGLFSVVSSPLSLLRNRFSKTSLQSSTPVKLQQKLNAAEDEIEVQNVSGVSVHEEIKSSDKGSAKTDIRIDDNDATLGEEAKEDKVKADTPLSAQIEANAEEKEFKDVSIEQASDMEQSFEQSDIKIVETPLQPAVGDPMAKNKKCVVM